MLYNLNCELDISGNMDVHWLWQPTKFCLSFLFMSTLLNSSLVDKNIGNKILGIYYQLSYPCFPVENNHFQFHRIKKKFLQEFTQPQISIICKQNIAMVTHRISLTMISVCSGVYPCSNLNYLFKLNLIYQKMCYP